ncbi:MAG: Bifunctional NAD(P)H-hydrate repair enzyme Nnr, partial [Marinimicrobia bacterium 46_43]
NGHSLGPVLRADKTITMGFYKAGLFLHEGKFLSGDILLKDLGYPEKAMEHASPTFLCNDAVIRSIILPVRGTDHKYSRGQAVCIGGHKEMPGAITLASLSALRTGAGMVRALIPKGVSQVIHHQAAEIICHTGQMEFVSADDIHLWDTLKARTKAVLIGPGMGRHKETEKFVRKILKILDIPAVLDADALNSIHLDDLSHTPIPLILTPHAGEFLRLTSIPEEDLQSDPVNILRNTAQKSGKIIHLKGATSMSAFPDGKIYIHPYNSPGMATAGSGDVLGGIITSLLAQGFSPEAATLCGSHFHGLAGIKAAEMNGCRGMIAGDLIHFLPEVMKEYEIIK